MNPTLLTPELIAELVSRPITTEEVRELVEPRGEFVLPLASIARLVDNGLEVGPGKPGRRPAEEEESW